jgi:outer membrane lipoprotein-sorting protein
MIKELVKSTKNIKYVYKYRSLIKDGNINENTLRMVCDGEVFFSNVDNFNDPFECSVDISCEAKKDEVIKHLQKNINTDEKNAYLLKIWLNDKEEFKRIYGKHMLISARKQFLIFCLAKYYDNILMWSHYADEHKGICIGYQTTDFDGYKTIKCDIRYLNEKTHPYPYLPLTKVKYATKKPKDFNVIKENPDELFAFIYTKAKLWKYENEYRIILNKDGLNKNPICINQSEIKEIIFGLRTESKTQDFIINKILSKNNNIKFYRINILKGKYALEREQIKI